jgi:hypothetical protein
MAKVKGLTLSKSEVSQSLNLEEILGVSFRGQRELRLAIAQRVIDYIVERTRDKGVDIRNQDFKAYANSYKDSTVFELLKDSDEPNLSLTGTMLASIDVLSDGPNTVVIGFDDATETLKAFNHNTGDTVKKREFFGIRADDAKKLIESEFSDELDRLENRDPNRQTVSEILARGILVEATDAAEGLAIVFNTIEDF